MYIVQRSQKRDNNQFNNSAVNSAACGEMLLSSGLFCMYWSTPIHVAVRNIWIPPFHHTMYIKMMVCFWHGADNFFIPRHPGKCLLTCHGIKFWVLVFDWLWIIFLLASRINMIFYVEWIYDLRHILPNILKISCIGYTYTMVYCILITW